MEKRLRLASSVALRCDHIGSSSDKECHGKVYEVDRLSSLPDEILLEILSFLDSKEAARTGILSPRWKDLWKDHWIYSSTASYEFDVLPLILYKIAKGHVSRSAVNAEFVDWVSKFLSEHRAPTLHGLRICFGLSRDCSGVIDKWVEFAMNKTVQSLDLDFSDCWGFASHSILGMRLENLDRFRIKPLGRLFSPFFASLKSLRLSSVTVTNQVFEHLLCDCPLLETLSVVGTRHLSIVKITESSVKLKSLEIGHCFIRQVKISSMNLIKFQYFGRGWLKALPFKKVPCLTELNVGGDYAEHFLYELSTLRLGALAFYPASLRLLAVLSQLETLKLDLCTTRTKTSLFSRARFPDLNNLQRLELAFQLKDGENIMFVISLAKACPRLHILTLKLYFRGARNAFDELTWNMPFSAQSDIQHAFPCLKVVEILGFIGLESDLALAAYILQYATELEKMVIDPYRYSICRCFENLRSCHPQNEGVLQSKKRAKMLETRHPAGAKLVIL